MEYLRINRVEGDEANGLQRGDERNAYRPPNRNREVGRPRDALLRMSAGENIFILKLYTRTTVPYPTCGYTDRLMAVHSYPTDTNLTC